MLLRREIDRDPAYAAALRWRVRHLFVDEFQDVNPLQHALLEAWRGGRDDLCVVGDPSQAIYGWNGADGRALADFAEHHPRATVIHLRSSHRSTPQIVAFGHAVLTGAPDGAPVASRPEGPKPCTHAFSTADEEARGLAPLLRGLRRPGGRWSAIAVLARTNAQLERIADALSSAGIPAQRRGADRDPAVAGALAELATLGGRGSLRAWLDEVDTDPPFRRAAEDLLAQDPGADGPAMRMWLASGGRGDTVTTDEDAVALLTFHAAKGLEWPAVVVTGAQPGLVPHASARTRVARDEERRLFHVAVTRAQWELHVTWSGPEPSEYLGEIAVDEPPAAPPAALDSVGARAVTEPDPVLKALQMWRRDAARAARIDDRVVVDDQVLAAIAAARPTTTESLAAVPGFGPLMARRHGPRLLAAIESVPESTC
jgi:DNA helicase-2/ATP-dependent DNA helicase PcrA